MHGTIKRAGIIVARQEISNVACIREGMDVSNTYMLMRKKSNGILIEQGGYRWSGLPLEEKGASGGYKDGGCCLLIRRVGM